MPDEPGALGVVQVGSPRANERHSFLSWPPASFENQWHQFAARGWVALALTPNSICSSNTIFASPCLLTRLIAAMCAGHIGIDIDGAATDCIPGGHIQTSFFQKARPRIDPIPRSDALLGVGGIPVILG